ncbi:hypothetical protein [Moorena sp. SIO4G3]|nr:hypothetical protein [Moorena sp. SIO4G3]
MVLIRSCTKFKVKVGNSGSPEQCGEMGRWGDGEMGRWGDGES